MGPNIYVEAVEAAAEYYGSFCLHVLEHSFRRKAKYIVKEFEVTGALIMQPIFRNSSCKAWFCELKNSFFLSSKYAEKKNFVLCFVNRTKMGSILL